VYPRRYSIQYVRKRCVLVFWRGAITDDHEQNCVTIVITAGDGRPRYCAASSGAFLCKEPNRGTHHLPTNGIANVRKNGRANISPAARKMAWAVI
jgi:hypothetical protein